MSIRTPAGITLALCGCHAEAHSLAADTVLDYFEKTGCEFITPTGVKDAQPTSRIHQSGNIILPLPFTHPELAVDLTSRSFKIRKGVARLGYLVDSKSILVSQSPAPTARGSNDAAYGLSQLAFKLFSPLHPNYGWIDESGENASPIDQPSAKSIRYLFWFNLFGPSLVQDIGRNFLLDSPAADIQELHNGAIALVSTTRFSDWLASGCSMLVQYLRKKLDNLEEYRSQGFSEEDAPS